MYTSVTGIILSGGKSLRMGENKSFLKMADSTIIERVRDLMKSVFNEVILITNTPDEYEFLKLPVFEDVYLNKGPLAGIHSGLLNSSTEKNFIISCDLPFISAELIKYLVNFQTDKPISVSKANGNIQPLAGKYSKNCVDIAGRLLENNLTKISKGEVRKKNGASVFSLLDKIDVEIVRVDDQPFYKDDLYLNMNSIEDYNLVIRKLNSAGCL